MFDPQTLVLAAVIVLAAYIVKGMTGFASALVAVPLLTIVFGDVRDPIIILSVFELVFAVTLLPRLLPKVDWRSFGYLGAGMLAGSVAGMAILQNLATDTMKRILGVVIILLALDMLIRGGRSRWRIRKPWGLAFGVAGGVLGGMFGTPGPPYVVYMSAQTDDKSIFRATLAMVFTLGVVWRLALFTYAGVFTLDRVKVAGIVLPACLLGLFIGHHIHLRVPEAAFRRIVAAILLASGVLCLVR